MRRRSIVHLAGWVLGSCLSLASAQLPSTAPATQPADPQLIPRLIRDLSSDDYQIRENAEDQLVRLGDVAESALRRIANSSDMEAASRAARALWRIDDRRPGGPTFVTLHFKDAPADQVFQELSRQGRFTLILPPNLFEQANVLPVTIDVDREPFWQVARQLWTSTGISPVVSSDWLGTSVMFSNGPSFFAGPCATPGPILLHVNSVSRSDSIRLDPRKSLSRHLMVNVDAVFDPRLCRVGLGANVWTRGASGVRLIIREAINEKGESLLIDSGEDVWHSPLAGGRGRFAFGISNLKCPATLGGSIAKLRGEIRYDEPAKIDALEIPNPATAKSISKIMGGRKYEVLSITEKDRRWAVQVRFERGSATPEEWEKTVNAFNVGVGFTPRLLDSTGRDLPLPDTQVTQRGPDSAVAVCTFSAMHNEHPSPPVEVARLIWIVPLEVRPVVLPFEMRDIPLPAPNKDWNERGMRR